MTRLLSLRKLAVNRHVPFDDQKHLVTAATLFDETFTGPKATQPTPAHETVEITQGESAEHRHPLHLIETGQTIHTANRINLIREHVNLIHSCQ